MLKHTRPPVQRAFAFCGIRGAVGQARKVLLSLGNIPFLIRHPALTPAPIPSQFVTAKALGQCLVGFDRQGITMAILSSLINAANSV